MPNPENLKPFKQGEDSRRNKDGRPEGSRNRSTIAREMLSAVLSMPDGEIKERLRGLGLTTHDEAEKLLTAVLLANGLSGVNPEKCYKELMDSAHGQAKQNIELDIPLRPIQEVNFVQGESIEHTEATPAKLNGTGNHT